MLLDDGESQLFNKKSLFLRPYIKLTELTVLSKRLCFLYILGLESDWWVEFFMIKDIYYTPT